MQQWFKRLINQQRSRNKTLERSLPDTPILCLIQEIINFLEQSLEPTPLLDAYTKRYSHDSMSLMLWNFIEWLAIDQLEKEPGYGLMKGLRYIKMRQGEVSEETKFLEDFAQTQEIFNEYFHIVGQRLLFRDTINRDEQISISRYIRENYIVPRCVF